MPQSEADAVREGEITMALIFGFVGLFILVVAGIIFAPDLTSRLIP